MQILDNTCHPDTKYPTHRAGDLYDMIETKFVTVKPAGEWNKIRIVSKNGSIQHWQNGFKVVEYQNTVNLKTWKVLVALQVETLFSKIMEILCTIEILK